MADLNKPGPSKPARDTKKHDEDESCLICNVVLNTEDLASVGQHYHSHLNKSIKELNTTKENLKVVEEEQNKLRKEQNKLRKEQNKLRKGQNKLRREQNKLREEQEEVERYHQIAKEALWRMQEENNVAEGA